MYKKECGGTIKVMKKLGIKRKTINFNNYKYIKNIGEIMYKHVKCNAKDYLILSIIFIVGIMIGVFLINNSNEESKNELNEYLTSFINVIKNENYEIDEAKLIKDTIISNIKIVLIIWILGTTILGIPLIYVLLIGNGVKIGYTISAIILSLGNWKGFWFSVFALLMQNFILIPIMLMASVSSLKLYRSLINKNRTINIKNELIRHTILCAFLLIPTLIAAILASLISSNLIIYFAKNFYN